MRGASGTNRGYVLAHCAPPNLTESLPLNSPLREGGLCPSLLKSQLGTFAPIFLFLIPSEMNFAPWRPCITLSFLVTPLFIT